MDAMNPDNRKREDIPPDGQEFLEWMLREWDRQIESSAKNAQKAIQSLLEK